MRGRITVLCGLTCVAATASISLGQLGGVCFKRSKLPMIQPSEYTVSCGLYTVCPRGYLCYFGNTSAEANAPIERVYDCIEYVGGSGTVGDCSGGIPSGIQPEEPFTYTGVDQNCHKKCLSSPPA